MTPATPEDMAAAVAELRSARPDTHGSQYRLLSVWAVRLLLGHIETEPVRTRALRDERDELKDLLDEVAPDWWRQREIDHLHADVARAAAAVVGERNYWREQHDLAVTEADRLRALAKQAGEALDAVGVEFATHHGGLVPPDGCQCTKCDALDVVDWTVNAIRAAGVLP